MNTLLKLSDTGRVIVELRVANERPSTAAAYLLLLVLGWFGAHRFYLKRTGTAVAMLLLTLTVIGAVVTAIWCIVDLFLIPSMIREDVAKIRDRVTTEEICR